MSWCTRAKLGVDGFLGFTARVKGRTSFRDPSSRLSQDGSLFSVANKAQLTGFAFFPSISHKLGLNFGFRRKIYNPFLDGSERFYYVDRYNVQHFRMRGPRIWFQNPRIVFFVVVGSCSVITLYIGNLETVPYTKRTHFVLLSRSFERKFGEVQFEQTKAAFKGKLLSAEHPKSLRVTLISEEIIEALQRGLGEKHVCTDFRYASEYAGAHEQHGMQTLMALKHSKKTKVSDKWHSNDAAVDDKLVQESRKKYVTSHLEGLNWEVLVIDENVVNAFCLPGGKIVIFTGLLEHFSSDAEIATIIGHEIAHAVARHAAEGITKNLWFAIIQLALYQFVKPDTVITVSNLFLRLPFSRRMEIEADYIGLLLIASAGFDPRVAPSVYEKLGDLTGSSAQRDYLSTHPSGKHRAQLLSQAKVMDEAFTIYSEVRAGRGVEGFL